MACLFNFDQISQCWLKTRSIDNAGTTAKFSKLFLQLISSRISTGRDVLLSLCPGTRAAARILGKTSLSQDVPGQKMFKKALNFQKKPFVPWLSRDCPGRDGTGFQNPIPARSVAKYQNPSQVLTGCPGPSRPAVRFWACPVVPLSRDNEGISVPLSWKVALSRPVGNPSTGVPSYVRLARPWSFLDFAAVAARR